MFLQIICNNFQKCSKKKVIHCPPWSESTDKELLPLPPVIINFLGKSILFCFKTAENVHIFHVKQLFYFSKIHMLCSLFLAETPTNFPSHILAMGQLVFQFLSRVSFSFFLVYLHNSASKLFSFNLYVFLFQ